MAKNITITGAQTIQRSIRVLKLIAQHPDEGLRLIDVARGMEIERPTAHRLLRALVAEGVLRQDASHRYRLGPLIFELSLTSGHSFNMVERCTPVLKSLAEETGDTSFLFVRSGYDAICLAREQGSYYIQTPVVPVGSRQPLGVSSGGLAILSALSEQDVGPLLAAIVARLPAYENLSAEEVWVYYHEARAKGYAAIANRAAPGVKGVGIPILGELGTPIAAITVATTISRMSEQRIREITPTLCEAAASMQDLLRLL